MCNNNFKESYDCIITEISEIAPMVFSMKLQCGALATGCLPGQFVHIMCPGGYLRRPISICDATEDEIRIVFAVKGEGLLSLSKQKAGDKVNVLGPLGKGFSASDGKTLLIGGGIGVFPLYLLGRKTNCEAILGYKNKENVMLADDFNALCKTHICTDDGSFGTKGFVTDVLSEYLKENTPDIICACGPMPMLKAVAKIANEKNIPCEISLEERMACGIGACLGCSVPLYNSEGEIVNGHVCKDGPVFSSLEVVL